MPKSVAGLDRGSALAAAADELRPKRLACETFENLRAQAAEQHRYRAARAAGIRVPGDLIAVDVRAALDRLGEITGETVTDDILHRIFRDFCVGK